MSGGPTGHDTVAALLATRAAATPQAPAFQVEVTPGRWEPITWKDFAGQVARLVGALQAVGLRKGDRLAIIAPVSLEWELLHHAALSCGVVVVGLDAHDLPERIAAMADKANVVAFAAVGAQVLSKLGVERLASCRLLLHLGAACEMRADGRWLTWAQFDAVENNAAASDTGAAKPASSDIATIIFTSGTTGEPKGIAYNHGQVCLAIDAICDAYGFVGPGSRLLCWLPLSNLFQRMVNLAGMRNGAATYLLSDPRRVMDVVATVEPDIFVGVPRFYEKLYDGIKSKVSALLPLRRQLAERAWEIGRRVSRYRLAGLRVPSRLAVAHHFAERLVLRHVRKVMGQRLRCMIVGSAPTPRHLLEEMHALGWLVLEAYGLSENVLPMAMNRMHDFRFGTVGRPLPGNQIEMGDGGVIMVRSTGLFDGYLGDTDRSYIDSSGLYVTGDLGQFDTEGYLSLAGRSNEIIKTSTGRRVAPESVEARLRQVSGIDQAMLVGNGRKCVVALCTCTVPTTEGNAARAHLIAALRNHVLEISDHERPLGVALLECPFSTESGELTSNLKLRRSIIEMRYADVIARLYVLIDSGKSSAPGQLLVI
jgi:long-chain acyl-CoA synthetase